MNNTENNTESNIEKDRWKKVLKESALIIIVLVILMLIILCCLLKLEFSGGIFDRKELLDVTSKILGGYLGCITAYVTFKCQKELDKEKRQEAIKKEIDYKKFMLFSLLDYTIVNTEPLCKELNDEYNKIISNIIADGIDVQKKLSNHWYKNYQVKLNDLDNDALAINYCEVYDKDIKSLKRTLNLNFGLILNHYDLEGLIYDENWTNYLDCIKEISNEDSVQKMQRIINWINLMNNLKDVEVIYFVLARKGIRTLIDQLSPEIREKGFRKDSFYL